MIGTESRTNLQEISTDIIRMHMDPEFWYQQHNLDSDALHLNNHMIDMLQKYMRGDATRMETYIELGSMVNEYKHYRGIFARSKHGCYSIYVGCRLL
jgi:hypothetical protein